MKKVPIFVALLSGILIGYFGHLVQQRKRQRPSMFVDSSWVVTARSCWTGLSVFHDDEIRIYLSDQTKFRAAFPGYATSTDADITQLASRTAPRNTLLSDESKQPRTHDKWAQYAQSAEGSIQAPTGSQPQIDPSTGERIPDTAGPWTKYAKKSQVVDDPWKVVDNKKYICTVAAGVPTQIESANIQAHEH